MPVYMEVGFDRKLLLLIIDVFVVLMYASIVLFILSRFGTVCMYMYACGYM